MPEMMTIAPAESAATIANGQSLELGSVPNLSWRKFRSSLLDLLSKGGRTCAYFGDEADGGAVMLYAVIADDSSATVHLLRTQVESRIFESLTPLAPQLHLFEREIAEQCGLRPTGHPWLKPVRFHKTYNGTPGIWPGKDGAPLIGAADFYRVEGTEVHEVAVGPVHAGIIEPGHFRFQCHGETVFHLEISLGYQHRGIEQAVRHTTPARLLHYMQTIAGDTSIGHVTACCQLLESLTGASVPVRAQAIRGIAMELERIANHVGDLGALAGDVGFLPTMSYCGRLRGDFLNMTALICGSRFGRGLLRPGGVRFDVDPELIRELPKRLDNAYRDTTSAVNLLWDSPSAMARFEETGIVSEATARQIGLVGPAARACGIDQDTRRDLPLGIYRFSHIPVSSWPSGDVFARAYVRWLEIQRSVEFIREQLGGLPEGNIADQPDQPTAANRIAVSLVEGWRGQIAHVAITDERGQFRRYKIVDPSFHNWFGLAMALRNQQISDFPLCNKSFNLSYCGHDL